MAWAAVKKPLFGDFPLEVTLFDRIAFAVSSREYTDEGYLKVVGRVARTGIQDYLASELELDGDPNRIVKVYRPAEEVFAAASLQTYKIADVTDDHPPKLVNSKTYRAVTVGTVIDAGERDGDFVKANLIIKDSDAIKAVESGKAQLSAGYTAEYDEDGGTVDGENYEYTQRNIKINHVAVVDRARAGAMARILDNKPEYKMATVTLDNGRAVELDAAVAAQVEDSIKRLTESRDAAEKKADGLQAKVDAAEEELEKEKEKSSEDAISKLVKEVSDTSDSAKLIAGKDFTCDSVDPKVIKRAALVAKSPSKGFDSKPDGYIEVAFDMAEEKAKESDDEEEGEKKKVSDSLAKIANDIATATTAAKPNSRQTYDAKLSTGWKGEK